MRSLVTLFHVLSLRVKEMTYLNQLMIENMDGIFFQCCLRWFALNIGSVILKKFPFFDKKYDANLDINLNVAIK